MFRAPTERRRLAPFRPLQLGRLTQGPHRDPVAEASHRAFLETALTGSAHTVQDIRAAFLAQQ